MRAPRGEYPAMAGHDGLRRRGRRCASRQSAPSPPAWPLRRKPESFRLPGIGVHDMNLSALQHTGPLAINMNQPGSFVHWSIFTVSVANLVLIAVMVVIFGAALLLPFPRGV